MKVRLNTPIVPDDPTREVVTTQGYLNKLSRDRNGLLEALESVLKRHDDVTSHETYKFERGRYEGRKPTKGVLNVFHIAGLEGQGFYPCWCNSARAAVRQAKGETK